MREYRVVGAASGLALLVGQLLTTTKALHSHIGYAFFFLGVSASGFRVLGVMRKLGIQVKTSGGWWRPVGSRWTKRQRERDSEWGGETDRERAQVL